MQKQKIDVPTVVEEGANVPFYATDGAAGADVRARLVDDLVLNPGCIAKVPTGLYFEIPEGYEIQVRPRSGMAFKHGVSVLNTPGTIDSDYRGELAVLLINHGKKSFTLSDGMRVAQLILAPVVQAEFREVAAVGDTSRGAGGFGHTGSA